MKKITAKAKIVPRQDEVTSLKKCLMYVRVVFVCQKVMEDTMNVRNKLSVQMF